MSDVSVDGEPTARKLSRLFKWQFMSVTTSVTTVTLRHQSFPLMTDMSAFYKLTNKAR